MTRLKNTRAFTLIELIVVIVIIGILAAVAAVSYNSFISNAQSTGAESQYSSLGKLIAAQSAADVADSASAYNSVQAIADLTTGQPFNADLPASITVAAVAADGAITATIDGQSCTGLTWTDNGQVSGTPTCAQP